MVDKPKIIEIDPTKEDFEKAKQKMIKEIQRRHGGPKIVH